MGFFIDFLIFLLVVDCFVLVFLVLIQLPKKEAGAGLAFGGAASDALFGAGSGNVLTKITKYAATVFFVMALFIGVLQSRYYGQSSSKFQNLLNQSPAAAPKSALPPSSAQPASKPLVQPSTTTSNPMLSTTPEAATNTPATAVPATNPPAQK